MSPPRLLPEDVDERRRDITCASAAHEHADTSACLTVHADQWALYRDVLTAIAAGHPFPEALAQAALGPDPQETP